MIRPAWVLAGGLALVGLVGFAYLVREDSGRLQSTTRLNESELSQAPFEIVTRPVNELLGDRGKTAIGSIDRVEAWLVFAPGDKANPELGETSYEQGPDLSKEQVRRLRNLLLSDDTLVVMNLDKRCPFHPDVQFRAFDSTGTKLFEMTFCFTCHDIAFTLIERYFGAEEAFDLAQEQFPDRKFGRRSD